MNDRTHSDAQRRLIQSTLVWVMVTLSPQKVVAATYLPAHAIMRRPEADVSQLMKRLLGIAPTDPRCRRRLNTILTKFRFLCQVNVAAYANQC